MSKIYTIVIAFAMSAGSSVFGAAYLDNVVNIQPTSIITNNVTSAGATLSSDRITVGENVIVNEGTGTLIVPNSKLDQSMPVKVTMREGSVKLDMSEGDQPAAATISDTVKAKLLWWGAIDDEGFLKDKDGNSVSYLTDGAQVATWYDHRETDTTNPQYYRMVVTYPKQGYPTFRAATNIVGQIKLATTNVWRGLYFGGYKLNSSDGIGMHLVNKSGTIEQTYDQHQAFIVQGQTSQYLGSLAGSKSANLNLFSPNIAMHSDCYLAPCAWAASSAFFWLDGKLTSGADTTVKKGVHLLEYASPAALNQKKLSLADNNGNNWCANCWAIFEGTGEGTTTTKDGWGGCGGDDVIEYMIFNQTLSEKERLEVENYLMRKWNFKTTNPEKRFNLAENSTATVEAATGTTVSNLEMQVIGAGKLVKTGAGAYVHDLEKVDNVTDVNPAVIDLQEGTLYQRRLVSPIFVGAGKTISASIDDIFKANKITVSDAAGKLVKTGNGRVRVTGLDSEVSEIDVQAGTLAIGGETENTEAKSDYWTDEIAIPNSGFETWDRGETGNLSMTNDVVHTGWVKDGGTAYLWDFEYYAKQPAFKWDNIRAPEGTAAVHLKQTSVKLRTANTLHFEKPGEYEFSCYMYGRVAASYGFMVPVQIKLLSSDKNTVVADFGTIRLTSSSGFQPKALRANVEAAGDYYLQIAQVYNCWKASIDGTKDCSTFVDDLHIRRLGSIDEKTYRIPNGDFESAEVMVPHYSCKVTNITEKSGVVTTNITTSGTEIWKTFTNENNHCTGWAFNDPSGWTDKQPAVGLVNPFTRVWSGRGMGDAFYSRDEIAYNGAIELLFHGNGANVTTTFKPPKGTWRLSALLATKHTNNTSGKLKATVTIGEGEPIELGELSTDYHHLYRQTWPTAFEVDGSTTVTITVTHETTNDGSYGIIADDFILTQRYYSPSEELLPQGTIVEASSGSSDMKNWTRTNGILYNEYWKSYTSSTLRRWGETPSAFGYGYFGGGEGVLEIWADGGAYTSVTFPCAGRYRLTYLVRRRLNTSGQPDVYFSLVKNGTTVTNVIEVSHATCPLGAMERRDAFFNVAEGGTYKLILKGVTTDIGSYQNFSDISIRPAFDEPADSPITMDTLNWVKVASGARLRLDFSGTNEVKHVRLGGKIVTGIINKETYPDYIMGDGTLKVKKSGFILIYQ